MKQSGKNKEHKQGHTWIPKLNFGLYKNHRQFKTIPPACHIDLHQINPGE
jgi:hypothetical protein